MVENRSGAAGRIQALLACARHPEGLDTLAIAGVLGQALATGRRPLIAGLSESRFQKLLNEYFVGIRCDNGESPRGDDEFDDLVQLLLEHRAEPCEKGAWLAFVVASATMGERHLWEDMGLPSRKHLSALLQVGFPTLAAGNPGGAMKWKKYFYRKLCERAEVPVCKAPHCAECPDYAECFGGG
jgi:nitrogen fixation protein NifQ